MRSNFNHVSPANTQPYPDNNNSKSVESQLSVFRATGQLIHVQIACEIASWYATPNNALAVFGSTGTLTEALSDDIQSESDWNNADSPLAALLAYVSACEVPVYSVGSNAPGYLPDSAPSLHVDYADAVEAYRAMLSDVPADLGIDDECQCDDDAMCDYCAVEAHVASVLTDEISHVAHGRVYGAIRPLDYTFTTEGRSRAYFLSADETMPYGEAIASMRAAY